jgi:N-acyl-D-amino-acid deacylase
MFDILIRNGSMLDGLGNQAVQCDIGIHGDRIAAIDRDLPETAANHVIDATGLTVTPGFIDIHSHTDFTILRNPRAESKIRQGITTELVGNCGFTAAPVRQKHFQPLMDYLVNTIALTDEEKKIWNWPSQADFMKYVEAQGTGINLAFLVGHSTIRVAVMGMEKREAGPDELKMMKAMLKEEMIRGIWGFSSGLQYEPARFAQMDELLALAETASAYNGLYATHMMSESAHLLECLTESIEVARQSGVSLQVSHLKAENPVNWYKVEEALKSIDQACTEGVRVGFDVYPYTALGSGLIDLIPDWVREAGIQNMVDILSNPIQRKKVLEDMDRPSLKNWVNPMDGTPWSHVRIAIVKSEENRWVEGRNMEEAAHIMGVPPAEAVLNLLLAEKGAVKMIFFGMREADVEKIMKHPGAMLCTDGRAVAPYGSLSAGNVHPRYYGTYPRILGHYVREKRIMTLAEAVKKMTSLPAKKIGLKERGQLKEGYIADITLFNAATINDKATFDKPHQYSEGIEAVIINGELAVNQGEHTGLLGGRVLKRGIDSL